MSQTGVKLDILDFNLPTGGELRIIREYLEITTEEASDVLGYERSTIRSWEKGDSSPRIVDVRNLLMYYELKLAAKLQEEDDGD